MSGAPVRWSIEGSCARISLCRPEVLNALNEESYIGLASAFDAIEQNNEVSVAVIDGGGCRAFSAGADLTFMRGLTGASLRRFIELSWRVGERIARSSTLTVARLNGYVLGGGAELALACDMRIASTDTAIGFPEMTYGSVPGSGAAQRLQSLIGPARAIEMMAGGRRFSALEAQAIGLVNAVADTEADVGDWLSPFMSRPREAISYMKAAMLLKNEPHAAAVFHGLVSATRQADAGYRARTEAFERERG